MKKLFKYILVLNVLIISCQSEDDLVKNNSYSHLKEVGYSARDILSNEKFTDIFVEILYVKDFKPSNEVLASFKNFISERTFKSNINIETKLIDIPLESSYSINKIRSIEDENRTKFSNENELAIFILYLNGASSNNEEDSLILGTAYRNTSFVIFKETIDSFSDSNLFGEKNTILESTIVRHEFSHLLGLVNVGTPIIENHHDSANGAHCTSENCLMYYKMERMNTVVNFFDQEKIPELDAFCLQDLRSNGGR